MSFSDSTPMSSLPSVDEGDPPSFEPEFVRQLMRLVEEHIPFNKLLGLKATDIRPELVRAKLAMRPELIGSMAHQRLHGGVISAALDSMAGLAIMAAIAARHLDEPPAQRLKRMARLGTIDLRVDYLRQGIGSEFHFSARVLRLGSRVASTQMECTGVDGQLIATGSAAYIVS